MRSRSGFTLVELLVVIGLIALLMGVVLGSVRGAGNQAAVGRARAELAVLSQLLEDYRRVYGDYPQAADTPEKFHQALRGRLGPTGAEISGRDVIGAARIPLRDPEKPNATLNSFVDPWGRAYQYIYYARDSATDLTERGYVLFSFGARDDSEPLPSRTDVVPEISGERGGEISQSAQNARNLYANP